MSTEYAAVKDSGKRESFGTGSVRDSREGKGRYDLIPTYPLARLARHYENGARKYGDRNWERGQPVSRYFDSAVRHLFRFWAGDEDEDHLSAAAWNVFAIIHTLEAAKNKQVPATLDDRPRSVPAVLVAEKKTVEDVRDTASVSPLEQWLNAKPGEVGSCNQKPEAIL